MNIKVQADPVADKAIVDGFCLASGWKPDSGKTKIEWLRYKIGDFVTRYGRQGYVMNAVVASRQQYSTDIGTASNAAKTAVPPPTIEAAAIGP